MRLDAWRAPSRAVSRRVIARMSRARRRRRAGAAARLACAVVGLRRAVAHGPASPTARRHQPVVGAGADARRHRRADDRAGARARVAGAARAPADAPTRRRRRGRRERSPATAAAARCVGSRRRAVRAVRRRHARHGVPFVVEGAVFVFAFTAVFSWPAWRAERPRRPRHRADARRRRASRRRCISWLFESVFLVRLP